MDEINETVRNFLNKMKKFALRHLKLIIAVVIAVIIIAGSIYVVMEWAAKTISMAAREFTSEVNIGAGGTMSTNISAQDLWDKMIKEGYEIDKYLSNPTELSKLLQAELVTKLPDTRSNVDDPIDWDSIFDTSKSDDESKSENETINILFIGNSKTYVNEIASCYQNLATSLGKNVYSVRVTNQWGGRTLKDYLYESGPSEDLKNRLKERKWDYIVLQEQTDSSLSSSDLKEGAVGITKLVRDTNNPKAKVVYAAWSVMGDYNESQYNIATRNYEAAKNETGGSVAYIASALLKYHSLYPSVNLFPDGLHPSREGTYLAAWCVYNAMFGEKTEGATETFGFSTETATNIQKVADETQAEKGATTAGEVLQGIIKFIRHDANGSQKSMTYADPETFNGWINEYKSSGNDNAKEQALSHFTLTKTAKKKQNNTNNTQRASSGIEAVIQAAESQIGEPYNYDGSHADPKAPQGGGTGFNCSGLVWWAFEQGGYSVDHSQCAYGSSKPNRGMIDTVYSNCGGKLLGKSELNRGDVLFYNTGDGRESGHVAIYLGNGERIHSNESGVHKDSDAFNSAFIGGGPLVVESGASTSSTTTTNNNSSNKGQFTKNSGNGYSQTYISSTGFEYKDFMQWRRII